MAAYERLIRNQEELHAAYAQIAANEQVLADDYNRLVQSEQLLRENSGSSAPSSSPPTMPSSLLRTGSSPAATGRRFCSSGAPTSPRSPAIPLPISPRSSSRMVPGRPTGSGSMTQKSSPVPALPSNGSIPGSDGTPFATEISLNAVVMGGKPSILSVIRDISERKQADTALRLARRKLHLMTDVSRHEIRATLTGLLKEAENAEAEVSRDKRKALIRSIREDIHRLRRQILFTEEYEEIGIHPPCWLPLKTLVPAPENLAVTIDPGLGDFEVFADPLVVKVFRYLAENTVRHGVRATEIRFHAEQRKNSLIITVEDNGTGIPAEDQEEDLHAEDR